MVRHGRNSLRLVVWTLAVGATAWVWRTSAEKPTERAVPPGVTVVRDLPYRGEGAPGPTLDVYLPIEAPTADRPAILAIHGGSWIGGSKREYGAQIARFARHGFVVAAVDYRLARPGAPSWDEALKDVEAAVDWMVDAAPDYRIDPRRIVALGTSAGGLLAAHLARDDLRTTDSGRPMRRVLAVVCLSTPYSLVDLAAARGLDHEPIRDFIGAEPPEFAKQASEASPIRHVSPVSRPILMIHGVDDRWVPIEQAREMREQCGKIGVSCRLVEVDDAKHGFELEVGGRRPRDLLPDVLDFLKQVESALPRP